MIFLECIGSRACNNYPPLNDLSTNELAATIQLSPISTGPQITTFGPIKTLLPILGTFLYGNFLTVENRKPNTQFSPISVPGISTVLIPLQTK